MYNVYKIGAYGEIGAELKCSLVASYIVNMFVVSDCL